MTATRLYKLSWCSKDIQECFGYFRRLDSDEPETKSAAVKTTSVTSRMLRDWVFDHEKKAFSRLHRVDGLCNAEWQQVQYFN